MGERYCRIVGILGAPDAGKTAALVSLYLLLARARLPGIEFCDSRTLIALDEISRGARRWVDGNPPQQMTAHTANADQRTAGFLHLRVRHTDLANSIDLLLPDLPGEWSTSLIDNGRVDRLEFIKSADAVWLMVDGAKLLDRQTKNHTVHRTRLMIQKVSELLGTVPPPVKLVITRLDLGKPSPKTLLDLENAAAGQKLAMEIVHIASFSDNPDVAPGTGISELLVDLFEQTKRGEVEFWKSDQGAKSTREMLKFGRTGAVT